MANSVQNDHKQIKKTSELSFSMEAIYTMN